MNINKIEDGFEPTADKKCSVAEGGMVATAFPDATEAGVEILKRGGNAIDAACAAAFALSVCEPQASGLGGQSIAIIHYKGKTIMIDGSSRVPSLAHISKIKGDERAVGYRAATVPSTPAALAHMHFHYGKLRWRKILEPAIRIARYGYRITKLQHTIQKRELENFLSIPSRSGARYFLKSGAQPYNEGDLFVQLDLAHLLEELAENGVKAFYQGEIARRIDEDMRANHGLIRYEDLAYIPWPVERVPIRRRYRDVSIATTPPPAAGQTLLLVMLMLSNIDPIFLRSETPESFHFLTETFRKAFLLRKQRPYDRNTYPQVSGQKMLNREFARELSTSIRNFIDPNLPLVEPPSEDEDTTHLSVIDSEGNAVGITQSIELVYGSKSAAQDLGFLYNNYMMALDIADPSHPYYLRPNMVPWSSAAPAIVFCKNKPWLVTGSPGSERIYSTISQFLVHMVDGSLSLCEAMLRPRLHCTIGGKLSIEADRFSPKVIEYLEKMGYKIVRRQPFDFYLGAVHAALIRLTGKGFQGVAEIRRDGTAGGP
jgi:gamma-glutamyltranspeptidase/glutathione hydrolase